MKAISISFAAAAALTLAACEHYAQSTRNTVPVNAAVTVADDGAGGYKFSYSAPFADERGNFDFSKQGAAFNTVKLTFTISAGSVSGLKFKPDGADAMWIVDKKNVDATTGSPRGPYRGTQFFDFNVSADGKQLTVTNMNDDEILYRYGLRFDLDGRTVVDDPDMNNGGKG